MILLWPWGRPQTIENRDSSMLETDINNQITGQALAPIDGKEAKRLSKNMDYPQVF